MVFLVNAQSSTGPRDTSATKLNALKHGLMAANLTPFDGDIFEPMLQHFRLERQPQGEIEDLLVQRIELYATRLHRAASLSADFMNEAMRPSVTDVEVVPTLLDHAAYATTGELPQKSRRLADLKDAVKELPAAISTLTEASDSPELVAALNRFSSAVEALPGGTKTSHDVLKIVETLESKFQRYETQLENRLIRLFNELERIQRMRAGESVPAPVNVNVAVSAVSGDLM
jgi:hypothetical protein